MSNNIDQLLSSLKAQQKTEKTPVTNSEDAQAPVAPTGGGLPSNPQSVDELLTQLQGTKPKEKAIVLPSTPIVPAPVFSSPAPLVVPLAPLAGASNPVLDELKAEFAERQRQEAEEQRILAAQQQREAERLAQIQQAALEKERQEQARLAQEQRKKLEKKAETWLKQLEPLSGESLWFDQFATHYSSRLEAAVAYLSEDTV